MKTYILFILLNFSAIAAFSQVMKYDYKVEYNRENTAVTANIKVTVTNGIPEFTFYLLKDDFDGEVIMKSNPTAEFIYTFYNVPEGKYLLKIEDKYQRIAGNTIIISKNEADKQ